MNDATHAAPAQEPMEDLQEHLAELEKTVQEQNRTINQLRQSLRSSETVETTAFNALLGQSTVLYEAIAVARAVAHVDSTVLITGESGTGKELIAKGIHDASPRDAAPFVAINCATLSESLQSSELFGHAKGAFTGALRDKPGLFEAANQGSLFLDEVAELAPSTQAALLRVLQEGVVIRLGEHRERPVDVRIIAATHRDLDAAMQTGAFRTDLFFRLNVVNIAMPALRERDNDVLLLAGQFIKEYNLKLNRTVAGLSPAVARLFLDYDWPGNVRELRNAVERAVLLARSEHIEMDDLPACLIKRFHASSEAAPDADVRGPMPSTWKKRILDALTQARGKRDQAAEILGVSRTTLWRKMRELGIND